MNRKLRRNRREEILTAFRVVIEKGQNLLTSIPTIDTNLAVFL
jgi:hypothetical protein